MQRIGDGEFANSAFVTANEEKMGVVALERQNETDHEEEYPVLEARARERQRAGRSSRAQAGAREGRREGLREALVPRCCAREVRPRRRRVGRRYMPHRRQLG